MLEHKKSKIDQYVDTSGQFSSRQLKIGTWYLLHRELFREIFIGFLITLCVVFYGFGLWKWGEYLFFGYWNDQEYLAKYTQTNQNYSSIQEIYKAQDLNVADVRVFATSENMYDFVAIGDIVTDAFIKLKDASVHCDINNEKCEIYS